MAGDTVARSLNKFIIFGVGGQIRWIYPPLSKHKTLPTMRLKMRRLIHSVIIIGLLSCSRDNKVEETLSSPNEKYLINIKVVDKNSKNDRSILTFRLLDNKNNELDYLNTGASDVMKWAAIWDNDSTVVLNSSDIGTYAWTIDKNNKFKEINVTNEMIAKGDLAYKTKYN